jgi:ABC-type multidrug transport system fused ATPase/permease subunit
VIDDTVRRNVALGLPDDRIDEAAVERACRVARLHDLHHRSRSNAATTRCSANAASR